MTASDLNVQTATQDWVLAAELAPHASGDALAPLYGAAARGELVLPFCGACALPLELDQVLCDGCGGGKIAWRTTIPAGSVHTVTMVHRRERGLVRATQPYPILDVELDEGHRMLLTTTSPITAAPVIGTRVRIGFRRLGDVHIPAVEVMEG